jgi:hypothetical protein
MLKSVKSATTFIKNLRATRGYNPKSTAEWRRLSMKLSDCALIQFARRLASRLETEKPFVVGVDEQDFNPKIYVLNGSKYCLLCLKRQVDERTGKVTYALGPVGKQISGHLINVSKPPTEGDLTHAFTIIESGSQETARTKPERRSAGE